MPSLQAFSMCLPIAGRLDQVPDQCPYKSTQSRILRHIITFSQPVFLFFTRVATALHSLVVLRPLRLVNSSMNSPPAPGDDRRYSYEFERRHLFGDMFEIWCRKKWLKFDQDWLTIRDGYAKSISDGEWWMSHDSRFYARKVGPLYDLTNGLFSIIAENADTTIQLSAFHCIQELTSSVIGENSEYPAFLLKQNQYLQKLLGDPRLLSEPFPTFSSILEKPSVELLKDENAFIFISQCSNPPIILLQHFAELHIRILNDIYSEQPLASTTASFPRYPENLCLYNYGKKTCNRDGVFNAQISDQFALIVDSFLKSVASHDIDNKTLLGSFNAQGSGEFLRYAVLRQSDRAIQPTLDFLTATLDQYTTADGKLDQRSDSMFYISAFYARSLMISDPWHFHFWSQEEEWDESPAVEAFLPAIRLYLQKRGTLDIALGERLGIPPQPDKWWGFLNRSVKVQDDSQEDPDKIAPIENDLNPNPGDLVLKLCSSADDLV
ncbi:hypothetical protein GALMADRAFT_877797 [Galerina marginata CBS 339.88]|uniref:Uncharacterized protein n=1 Tax=Galerina marginata (strain CBS 339.88) TaxID=685588 RepID=A0A067SKJ7_GALM3|nr:hypothetical protein GALMADRAFT_877797 [Galerina marginata CBS 339.88]